MKTNPHHLFSPWTAAFVVVFVAILAACSPQTAPVEARTITGAGSTFAAPLMKTWAEEYSRRRPEVRIDYQAVGSGEGEKRFLTGEVDFAGTDAGIKSDVLDEASRGAIQIPITAGIIVLAYNPDGLPSDLKLPRDLYADLFLGKPLKWDDARIQTANPGAKLPSANIAVVVRQDSSGTTFAFSNHLAAINSTWRGRFGNRQPKSADDLGVKVLDWPGAVLPAPGNDGVAGLIKRTPYSIGYVQYGAARDVGLEMAWLQNKAGTFVQPTGTSGLETLLNVKLPPNRLGYFPDPEGEFSYPIVTFTWMLIRGGYRDDAQFQAVKDFARWCLASGQDYSEAAGNTRLAPQVIRDGEKALRSLERPAPSSQ